jgi:hypothetical protein
MPKIVRTSGAVSRIANASNNAPGTASLASSSALWGESILRSREERVKAELDAASSGKTGRERREARLAAAKLIKEREEIAAAAPAGGMLAKKKTVKSSTTGSGGAASSSLFEALDEISAIAAAPAVPAAKGTASYTAALHFTTTSAKGNNPLAALRLSMEKRGLTRS